MQLFIHNIPDGVDVRKLRSVIGRSVYKIDNVKVKYKVILKKRNQGSRTVGHGKIVIEDKHDRYAFDLVNRRIPVFINNVQLKFKLDDRVDEEQLYWDQRQLEAVRGEDVDSDYEEEKPFKELRMRQVSCGAWDSEGQYVDAWRRGCDLHNPHDCVKIDEERGRLILTFGQAEIRIHLYNVKYSILDRTSQHLYVVLRSLPTFFKQEIDRKIRVSSFGNAHRHCAEYCYVYRILYDPTTLQHFLQSHAKRLITPDQVNITLSPIKILNSKAQEDNLDIFYRTLPFDTAFQVEALITSWQLLPVEVYLLKSAIFSLDTTSGADRVKALARKIKWRDPRPGKIEKFTLQDIHRMLLEGSEQIDDEMELDDRLSEEGARMAFHHSRQEKRNEEAVYVHCLTVTPSGKQLSGPFQDTGNRILRQYPGLDNQYLRVSFKDEMGEMIKEEFGIDSQEEILLKRFRNFLENGVVIGGFKFDFLAFSNSQLKSHGCWFVRSPLVVGGTKVLFAKDIRESIGILSGLTNAPLYAARLGQAFTTTLYSIKVPVSQVYKVEDIYSPCKKYRFSDGVGQISSEMVALLNAAARKKVGGAKGKPSNVYQIRLDGCKGVLALNTTLREKVVVVRSSMIKFRSTSSEWDLAVATSYSQPLRFYLHRPLIALLETLGVPYKTFQDLQEEALVKIGAAASNTTSAARLLQELGLGLTTRVKSTLMTLQKEFLIDAIAEIPFFKEVIRTAVAASLRAMKYKARIKVPNAYTLMGIMDETGLLEEDEVYACLQEGSKSERLYLKGRHLILRSPTLHPGDVQYAKAIGEVPVTSPLHVLTNCLIFSKKGKRPLPSMLAGGDLDGDLYNIIGDQRLFPEKTYVAAEYPPVTPVNIGRRVETSDVVDFYLQYIVNDKVGMLANKHLIVSDQSKSGVLDPMCIALAQKYSVALDYPKTGVQVDLRDIPRTYGRPDYMEHEYAVEERADHEEDKRLNLLGRRSNEYYKSNKALGKLFRRINVSRLLEEWGLEKSSAESVNVGNDWEVKLLKQLKPSTNRWVRYLPYQRHMVQFYYEGEEALAVGFHSEGRMETLHSAEVFLGCILLKSPFQASKNLYEAAESLRGNFRELVKRFMAAASSPPECEPLEISQMIRLLGKMEEVEDERQDSHYYFDDDDDDDNTTVRSQDFMEEDHIESWTELGSQIDSSDRSSQYYGEERIAEELHSSLYALFFAALEAQKHDPSKMTCPWIVYPRLLAAKKNVQRLEL
ncbi:hypothetical protein CBS101457_001031 [Exobasidium rhododendri]|nr:hypothetical protein CBS101457_001031 [Exobasidium rhododendri]